MNLGLEIAKRTRELRISKGMTQESLAKGMGVDTSFVGRIERAQTPNIQAKTVDKIIKSLDVSYSEFFTFQSSDDHKTSIVNKSSTISKTSIDRKTSIINKISFSQNQEELLDIIERIVELDSKK